MQIIVFLITIFFTFSCFALNFLTARVKAVDTKLHLLVEMDQKERKVKLLGIDTSKSTCLSLARKYLQDNLVGKEVQLEFDANLKRVDEKGTILAHVWHGGKLINLQLIEKALVKADVTLGKFSKEDEYFKGQYQVKKENRGVWSGTGCSQKKSKVTKKMTKKQKLCGKDRFNCSDFRDHAEAQRLYDYCGGVGYDIHKIDGDQNGLACESLLPF